MRNTVLTEVEKINNHIKTTNKKIETLMFDLVDGNVTEIMDIVERLDEIRM
jgi:hypothetical protein